MKELISAKSLYMIALLIWWHPAQAQGQHGVTQQHDALLAKVIGTAEISPQERIMIEKVGATFEGRQVLRKFVSGQRAITNTFTMSQSPISLDQAIELKQGSDLKLEEVLRQINTGVEVGLMHVLTDQKDPSQLRALRADELKAFKTRRYLEQVSRAANFPKAFQDTIRVLPVAIDGQPIVEIPNLRSTIRGPVWTEAALKDLLEGDEFGTQKSVGPETTGGGFIPNPPSMNSNALVSMDFDKDTFFSDQGENSPASSGHCGLASGRSCFLYAVSLHNSGAVQCSGVQVAPGWVLTAAHCTCRGTPQLASVGQATPNRFGIAFLDPRIVPGASDQPGLSASSAIGSERHYFSASPAKDGNGFCDKYLKLETLPVPDPDTSADAALGLPVQNEDVKAWLRARKATYEEYDLALIKLSRPLRFGNVTPIAKIAKTPLFAHSKNYRIVGFGRNDWEPKGGHKTVLSGLQTAAACRVPDEGVWSECIPEKEMLLVAYDGRSDSCNGDSGAGVYQITPDGSVQLIAIVSRALKGAECGPGGINVIVASARVRAWIKSVVSNS